MFILVEAFVKLFSFKIFGRSLGSWLLWLAIGFVAGVAISVLIDRVEVKWKPPRNYEHCSEKNVDDYYFQKLETFVDPRDSNEYTVLKFAEYRGCGMSEYDSGFVAGGDTVTFHLMLENLRYKTRWSVCLDSSCERGRYYAFKGRIEACPAGWNIASARQNAGLFFSENGRLSYWPTFNPIKVVDPLDPSGLKRLRSRLHEKNWGLVDTVELNLSGFYNTDKSIFELVDSLSIVWTAEGFPTVIVPNNYTEEEKKLASFVLTVGFMKPEYYYPIRCIRIDDPNHKMDSPKSNLTTYYNNMRELPYLYQ